mmetsp:Transcript_2016/g.6346  ORF Transcript_2016/g.6346 Transcript_2016/m.6346 type:complete len:240 (-) Transcript_2016:424-1143(-)
MKHVKANRSTLAKPIHSGRAMRCEVHGERDLVRNKAHLRTEQYIHTHTLIQPGIKQICRRGGENRGNTRSIATAINRGRTLTERQEEEEERPSHETKSRGQRELDLDAQAMQCGVTEARSDGERVCILPSLVNKLQKRKCANEERQSESESERASEKRRVEEVQLPMESNRSSIKTGAAERGQHAKASASAENDAAPADCPDAKTPLKVVLRTRPAAGPRSADHSARLLPRLHHSCSGK